MAEATGKELRLANLLRPPHGRGLWIDASAPAALGQMPGLEDAAAAVVPAAAAADGIVLNPGMAERLAGRLPGKRGAGLIIRLDWTNAFRGAGYPLPAREVRQVQIGTMAQARFLGAEAVIMSLLLGYNEEFEAAGVERMAAAARECEALGLPFVVDIRPSGPRVRAENWAGAVKLGAGFAVEGGADAVVLPHPGDPESWEMLRGW